MPRATGWWRSPAGRYGGSRAILIGHAGNFATFYGHLSRTLVHAGQRVRRGQVIGYMGNTGQLDRASSAFRGPAGDHPRQPTRVHLSGRRVVESTQQPRGVVGSSA